MTVLQPAITATASHGDHSDMTRTETDIPGDGARYATGTIHYAYRRSQNPFSYWVTWPVVARVNIK